MYSLSRPLRFAALAIAALALTGCASMNVSSLLERENSFPRYRTYNWAPPEALETGDPRLDNNPFFHERIQADVEKQLAARGFEKTASGVPDLLIHYRASVRQRVDVNGVDPESAYCKNEDACRPYAYEAGTLLIDLVDTRTDKLVWRGWAEDSVDGVIDNQRLMEEKIDKAVTRILQRLPGRL
jgi:uncharacterized protein DUF4136